MGVSQCWCEHSHTRLRLLVKINDLNNEQEYLKGTRAIIHANVFPHASGDMKRLILYKYCGRVLAQIKLEAENFTVRKNINMGHVESPVLLFYLNE